MGTGAGRTVIGGLLIDAMVLGAVVAFAWAGTVLGGRATLARLVASYVAFGGAAVLRDPIGSMIRAALHTSQDFSRLTGMVLVGGSLFIAVSRVLTWWLVRRAPDADELEDEDGYVPLDRLDGKPVAVVAGAALGYAWVVCFVGVLVLLPSDTPVSRAAVSSMSGDRLITHERALRWFSTGFPHYTQRLPKGEDGAVVGERSSLVMWGEEEPRTRTGDADVVLSAVNSVRRADRVRALTFNSNVAAVARRHSLSLAENRTLSRDAQGGGSLDRQIQAALGSTVVEFRDEYHISVAWSARPGNAAAKLLSDDRSGAALADPAWSEVGIGVADAGWFDGRFYVIILLKLATIEPESAADDDASATSEPAASLPAVSVPADTPAASSESLQASSGCDGNAIDLDGDGVPDADSVDPTAIGCDPESGPVPGL